MHIQYYNISTHITVQDMAHCREVCGFCRRALDSSHRHSTSLRIPVSGGRRPITRFGPPANRPAIEHRCSPGSRLLFLNHHRGLNLSRWSDLSREPPAAASAQPAAPNNQLHTPNHHATEGSWSMTNDCQDYQGQPAPPPRRLPGSRTNQYKTDWRGLEPGNGLERHLPPNPKLFSTMEAGLSPRHLRQIQRHPIQLAPQLHEGAADLIVFAEQLRIAVCQLLQDVDWLQEKLVKPKNSYNSKL